MGAYSRSSVPSNRALPVTQAFEVAIPSPRAMPGSCRHRTPPNTPTHSPHARPEKAASCTADAHSRELTFRPAISSTVMRIERIAHAIANQTETHQQLLRNPAGTSSIAHRRFHHHGLPD